MEWLPIRALVLAEDSIDLLFYVILYLCTVYICIYMYIYNIHVCKKVVSWSPSGSWWAPPHTSWPFAALWPRHDTTPWCRAPRRPRWPAPALALPPRRGSQHLGSVKNGVVGGKSTGEKMDKIGISWEHHGILMGFNMILWVFRCFPANVRNPQVWGNLMAGNGKPKRKNKDLPAMK